MIGTLVGNEVASSRAVTLVYTATHRGDDSRLPYMNRSFISFSFGGKNIEDFGLIAVTQGDRLDKDGSSNFNNITTSYDVVNGLMYWGTYFEGNTLHLTLATDGITQRLLDDFLRWFRGGETRQLILAEHPNRGIYARVAEPPGLSLLPFEQSSKFTIGYDTFSTSTTLYRGEITLVFQMDEPFWHAIENIFGYWDGLSQVYKDVWVDANGNEISIYDPERNKDAVKIMLEDGIPFSSMILDNMLLGNNIVAETSLENGAIVGEDSFIFEFTRTEDNNSDFNASYKRMKIIKLDSTDPSLLATIPVIEEDPVYTILFDDNYTDFANTELTTAFLRAFNNSSITVEVVKTTVNNALASESVYRTNIWHDPDTRSHVGSGDDDSTKILGVSMIDSTGVTIAKGVNASTKYYFYYAGTAPAYPILEFTMEPRIASSYYIDSPANTFASGDVTNPYNTFTIESSLKLEFKFTTPNIYTSFNTAMLIFKNNLGTDANQLYSLILDNVKHYAIRAWAMRIVDYYIQKKKALNSTIAYIDSNAMNWMKYVLYKNSTTLFDAPTYHFDSKTGLAYTTFTFRDCSKRTSIPDDDSKWSSYCTANQYVTTLKENVGDMVKSNWLVIKERNNPDESNFIRAWTNSTEEGKLYSHRIYHDVLTGLSNVKLIYNNMYV